MEFTCDIMQKLFLLYVTITYCDGDILQDIFPLISNISEDNIDELDNNDNLANNLATIKSASTINPPQATKSFIPIPLPSYINGINETRIMAKFITEFQAGAKNEDTKLNFKQLINKCGFEFERHEVFTKDGYVLNIFRIFGIGPVVFLMHGLLGSADDFIIAGPESGLAYLLAEEGYDVWLGNARGTKHSRRHIWLNASEGLYWDFSFHEIGVYDLPAMIDYVLEKTNQNSLKYIGYSQGTTSFFVMASERPEYNRKISLMVALSPVAYMSRTRSPMIKLFSLGRSDLKIMSFNISLHEFYLDDVLMEKLKRDICGTGALAESICTNPIFLMAGFDFVQLNITNLPMVLAHLPAGGSMKQFVHYSQGLLSEDFQQFDYGIMENSERYGTMVPPNYSLEKIVTPVSIYFSESDWLADPQDVTFLGLKLKNVIDVYRVQYENFNHVDFIIAKDVKTLVYKRVLQSLVKY